jgi:hypothetical protein
MSEQTPQTTLRETLAANFDAVEEASPAELRPRDEEGKFVAKTEKVEKVEKPQPELQVGEGGAVVPQVQLQRPSTWKKDYLPMWDKLAQGQPLTADEAKKLAEYTNQREVEYKTGVSTYKTEAESAKELREAITPFLPDLQASGVQPSQWIKELGQTHQILVRGTPQQKFQVMQQIARRYGVPLQGVQSGGVAPIVGEFMQQLQNLSQEVRGIKTDRQQQEMQVLQGEVAKFVADTTKHPHAEAVREQMAQLLESGLARDLESAYDQAIYLNPEVRALVLSSMAQPQPKVDVVAQAKAKAVSPKSATPSGQAKTSEAKDRRSILAEKIEALGGGRV